MYLIQRAKIKTPLNDFAGLRLSQAVSFGYMGSAEFEFGALPKSFRAFEAGYDKLKLRVVSSILNDETPLHVLSLYDDAQFAEYEKKLIKLRNGKIRLKERSEFEADRMRSDFWWDIENQVMFSFNKNFMDDVQKHLDASLKYMNEK